jgi:hypothetical protein
MKKKKKHNPYNVLKGKIREDHFKDGGTLAEWRGKAATFPDKKKKESKNKCRGKLRIPSK